MLRARMACRRVARLCALSLILLMRDIVKIRYYYADAEWFTLRATLILP